MKNKTNELNDIATLRLVTDAYKVSNPMKMLLLRYLLKRIKKKLPLAFVSYLLIDLLQNITGTKEDVINT